MPTGLGIAVKNEKGDYIVSDRKSNWRPYCFDYLLSQKKGKGDVPDNGVVLKTIVTSEFGSAIARSLV